MKAVKLPSGSYRCRVWDNKLKKQVSFTADTRKEAERLAAVYDFETKEVCSLTFEEAYEEHMASHKSIWKITVPQIVIDKVREYGLPNLTPDHIYDEFCKALTNAGIEHYRFHDLRHFCAARMLSKGIPIAVVQQYGGWKDEKTLMRIYNYVIDEVKKESMDL